MSAFLRKQDWFLNGAALFLAACSLLILHSISKELFWQQLIWFGVGILMVAFFVRVDWRPLMNCRWAILGIYLFSVLLLIITYIVAPTIRSTRSWIVIGPVQFQTSEIAKLALILVLACFFARRHIGIARVRTLFKSFIYFLIPAALIFIQPDLGSAIIIFCIWFGFLLVSGMRWRHLLTGLLILILAVIFSWNFVLKDYQKDRVTAFINPSYDPLGVNYSVIQSKIAIGSAGFFGKGYGQGTQVQLGFLPAAGTDFIFSAFTEEWGLLGGMLIIGAFVFMLIRIIRAGLLSHDNFSKLISLGATIMFLAQFVINMGSALGMLPVIGVTFPFFSYGGSSILANAMLIGIIQSTIARSSFVRQIHD